MAGPWKTVIKPALLRLRARRASLPLYEEYFKTNGDVFCKCGIQITRGGIELAQFTQVDIKTPWGNHITACCLTCAPKLLADRSMAADYILVDIVIFQDQADQVTATGKQEDIDKMNNLIANIANHLQ